MRERMCAYCGEHIAGLNIEMSVCRKVGQNSSMIKVDLHPECFDKVWEKAHKAEREEDEDQR